MAKAKKSTKKEQTKSKKSSGKVGFPYKAEVVFVLSLLLLFFSALKLESFWAVIHNFLLGTLGFLAFPTFILTGYISLRIAIDRYDSATNVRTVCEGIFIFLFSVTFNVFFFTPDVSFTDFLSACYQKGVAGGGLIGGVLSFPLAKVFSKTGAAIILILLLVSLFLFVGGISLKRIAGAFSSSARKIKSGARSYIDEKRAEEKETERLSQGDDPLFAPKGGKKNCPEDYDISLAGFHENQPKSTDNAADGTGRAFADASGSAEESENGRNLDDIIKGVMDDGRPSSAKSPKKAAGKAGLENGVSGDAAGSKGSSREPSRNGENAGVSAEKSKGASDTRKKEQKGGIDADLGITIEPETVKEYRYPPLTLLDECNSDVDPNIGDELRQNAELLVDTLKSFGVETRIINISRGPSVTRYELQPAAGVKISKITNLSDDIALNLATVGVRIEAPIPGKAAVGIEVPNKATSSVRLREIIGSKKFEDAKSKLTVAVGKDIAGNVVIADLAKMPHLLIAGTTGSGKSVCINSFILSVLFKSSPEDVKMLMIDPKVVELEIYNGLPHLLVPVVTDPKKAAGALGWAVTEMEKRYKLFGEHKVRDIKSYNDLARLNPKMETMPQILIIVDELNDLMMVAPGEVEDSICRLAQKARAAGMNLVIATQRPSVDVLTGLIKANIPSRIALKVANRFDSGTIIDTVGAEKLLGRGDMLFYPVGLSKPLRVQGCWVPDNEINAVLEYITADDNSAKYSDEISEEIEKQAAQSGKNKKAMAFDEGDGDDEGDEMLPQAIEVVVEAGMASTSLLQRKLKLGYARAARIMDMMEQRGVIGPFEGSKPRKVLVTKQHWQEMKMNGTLSNEPSQGFSDDENDFIDGADDGQDAGGEDYYDTYDSYDGSDEQE